VRSYIYTSVEQIIYQLITQDCFNVKTNQIVALLSPTLAHTVFTKT